MLPATRSMPTLLPRVRWKWDRSKGVLAVWALLVLGLVVSAYLRPHRMTVFPVYADAGRAWWAGANMYVKGDAPDLYRYSPAFAVLASPFALLPPAVGNAAWKLANVAVFAVGLWVWAYRVVPWAATRDRVAGLFFVAALASLGSFFNGQANLTVTGFVLIALAALAGERWWLAAGFLAAATLVKVFPLALAAVLCVLYWRTLPLRFAVALLVGLALPFAAQRPEFVLDQTGEWLRHLAETNERPRAGHRSLDALLSFAGLDVSRRAFQALAAVAGAVVLAVAVTTARRGSAREALAITAAWFLTWAVLFGPSAENATFAILAPVLAWATVTAFERPGAWLERAWLVGCVYLIGLSTSDAGGPYRQFFGKYHATTVGAVLFQAWLVTDLFRRSRATAQADESPAPAVTSRRAA